MDARRRCVLVGAAVLLPASCTAVSGLDSYVFDLTDAGVGAAAGHTSWDGGDGAGGQLTGGSAGAPSSGGSGALSCDPGDTLPQGDCGNCGTLISYCTYQGIWGPPSCEDEGDCSEGATQQADCDLCSHEICQDNCTWDDCELRPGNECNYGDGGTWQYCDGGTTHWRYCLPSCVWASCMPI